MGGRCSEEDNANELRTPKNFTLGDLFKNDIIENKAFYWLFYCASYCVSGFRFLNETKYGLFDYPPSSLFHHETIYPRRFLSVVGDQFPVLADGPVMNDLFLAHWKQCVPQFRPPTIKSIDEGLKDQVKILCTGPMTCIPEAQHFYEPKMHYGLQRKSIISKIGVPCPRVMSKDNASFPCLVKADATAGGKGNFVANTKDELQRTIHHLVDELGWKGGYIIEELLTDVSKVLGYYFYLSKAKGIIWQGIYEECFEGRFGWAGCLMDLDKLEELKNEVHQEFTLPLANYLSDAGYFGLVSYELIFTQTGGLYMVDLNLRVTGSATHVLIAQTMSHLGYKKSRCALGHQFGCKLEDLIQKVDKINGCFDGRVIIMSGADTEKGCKADYSIHGKSKDELDRMLSNLLTDPIY